MKFKALDAKQIAVLFAYYAAVKKAREVADHARNGQAPAPAASEPARAEEVIPEPEVDLQGSVTSAWMEQLRQRAISYEMETYFASIRTKYLSMTARQWRDAWELIGKNKMHTPRSAA